MDSSPSSLDNQIKPEWSDVSPVSTHAPSDSDRLSQSTSSVPTISDRVGKGESLSSILEEIGRPVDYEFEKKRLKRERNSALIADIAGVVGDTAGLAFGARQFYPRQSYSALANNKVEKLNDFKRADDIRYNEQILSAKYKDYEIKRAKEIQDAKVDYQLNKDEIANGRWGAEMKLKVDRLNHDLLKDKISQEKWAKEYAETVRQHRIANSQGERRIAISERNAETAREMKDAKINGGGESKSNSIDSITVKGADGKPKRVDYPKHMNAALTSYLYNRMKQIATDKDPKSRKIEDIAMQFGEGGDQASKMSAIVKRRIYEFPELVSDMEKIIKENSTRKSSSNSLPGNVSGSLLPK